MPLLNKSATLLLQFQTEDKAVISNFFIYRLIKLSRKLLLKHLSVMRSSVVIECVISHDNSHDNYLTIAYRAQHRVQHLDLLVKVFFMQILYE